MLHQTAKLPGWGRDVGWMCRRARARVRARVRVRVCARVRVCVCVCGGGAIVG